MDSILDTPANLRPAANIERFRHGRSPVAVEGVNGFSQCWYPIALSEEVLPGRVRGYDFLDGRVIVVRGEDRAVQVLSAYCPHLGTDLSEGEVIGNEVRCPFHHWSFDRQGFCTQTRVKDKPPSSARLFRFPTLERYGVVWAFNGQEPLYDLPSFGRPDSELLFKPARHIALPCDPWVVTSNSFDLQHFIAVHDVQIDLDLYFRSLQWGDFSITAKVHGPHGENNSMTLETDVEVVGNNCIVVKGPIGGRWQANMIVGTIPTPGQTDMFLITAVEKGNDAAEFLEMMAGHHFAEGAKDSRILRSMRFFRGTLVKSDRALGLWFEHLQKYPRAHPAASQIT